MAIDLFCGVILLLFALHGYRSGALLQLLRLCALALALALARATSGPLAPPLAASIDASPVVGQALAFFFVFVAALVLLRLVSHFVSRALVPDGTVLSGINRILGLALGTTTAAVILYAGLSAFVIVSARLAPVFPSWRFDLSGSLAARAATTYNLFDFIRVPQAGALQAMAEARSAPEGAVGDATADDIRLAGYATLARHPKASFLEDPKMLRAISDRDWGVILSDPRVWAFLTDPEVLRSIDEVERAAAKADSE